VGFVPGFMRKNFLESSCMNMANFSFIELETVFF